MEKAHIVCLNLEIQSCDHRMIATEEYCNECLAPFGLILLLLANILL